MKRVAWTILYRVKLFFYLSLVSITACTQDSYLLKRMDMVRDQIVARGITDPDVVRAMQVVERHLFVPVSQASEAYRDGPLPIGHGQTISQPYIVAYMTEVLDLNRDDRVLEVGTGSGYQAAILGELCDSVFSVEIVTELGTRAGNLLKVLGYEGVKVKIDDGYMGWKEHAPFDAIIVTCAPTHIPQALQDQLKEGGRMIIPVGEKYVQELILLQKRKGKLYRQAVLPVLFVPMVDENGRPY